MRLPQKKHVGKVFSMLTIIDQIPGKKSICQCECGNIKTFQTGNILHGFAKSCGCIDSINRKNYDQDAKKKLLNSIEINENGCWVWKKSRHRQGYGNFPYKRKVCLAHRISWVLHNGPLLDSILVLHKCDNPPCCNPQHLFLGSDKDNVLDAFCKGRIKRKFHNSYKLNEQIVKEIRICHQNGMKCPEISKKFGISRRYAGDVVNRKSWKDIN